MLKCFFLLIFSFSPLKSADINSALSSYYQSINPESLFGPIPAAISSIKTLQSYVSHYLWQAELVFVHNLKNKDAKPFSNKLTFLDSAEAQGAAQRLEELFPVSMQKMYPTYKDMSDPTKRGFGILAPNLSEIINRNSFNNFLMKQSDIFPDYHTKITELLKQIHQKWNNYKDLIIRFNTLTNAEMQELLGCSEVDIDHKAISVIKEFAASFSDRIVYIARFMKFIIYNGQVQTLEVYLLAELIIQLLSKIDIFINNSFYTPAHLNIKGAIFTAPVICLPINYETVFDGVKIGTKPWLNYMGEMLFRHPQLPFYGLYGLLKESALALEAFAHRFRTSANLPPLPKNTFLQNSYMRNVQMACNLPSIEQILLKRPIEFDSASINMPLGPLPKTPDQNLGNNKGPINTTGASDGHKTKEAKDVVYKIDMEEKDLRALARVANPAQLLNNILNRNIVSGDFISNNFQDMSAVDFEKKIGSLPEAIKDKSSFHRYVAHYFWHSHKQIQRKKKKITYQKEHEPLRVVVFSSDHEPTPSARALEIYPEEISAKLSQIQSVETALDGELPVMRFYLLNHQKFEDAQAVTQIFRNFLMKNNESIFPDYLTVLKDLRNMLLTVVPEWGHFYDIFANLDRSDTEKLLQCSTKAFGFCPDDNIYIKCKIGLNRQEQIRNLIKIIDFFERNTNTVQLLDLYLFAEHILNIVVDDKELMTKANSQKLFLTKYHDKGACNPVSFPATWFNPNLAVSLLRHPQFPLVKGHLALEKAILAMRNFITTFREMASLPPLYVKAFASIRDDRTLDTTVNDSLPKLEDVLQEKLNNKKLQSEENKKLSSKNKHAASKKKAQRKTRTAPKRPFAKEEKVLAKEVKESEPKLSIGARVYAQLASADKALLHNLFLCKENTIKFDEYIHFMMAVYRVLLKLGKTARASEFLKRSVDTRIFIKGKSEEFLSKASLEYRLLPFTLQTMIHPEFSLEDLLKNSEFLCERTKDKRIKIKYGESSDKLDNNMITMIEKILTEACKYVDNNASTSVPQRILLINLAHTWHKLSKTIEYTKGIENKETILKAQTEQINSLLNLAEPHLQATKHTHPISTMESYLYYYYQKKNYPPEHEHLTKKEFKEIKKRATEKINQNHPIPEKTIQKVDRFGNEYHETTEDDAGNLKDEGSSYTVSNSIFHAVTNFELGDYIMVVIDKPLHDRQIPLFVTYKGVLYRTDVIGGSRLKPDPNKKKYGYLFGVTLRAADFFKYLFTSKESFWYGQRGFFAGEPNAKHKVISRKISIATVLDKDKKRIFGRIIVQDGFGAIKASLARSLGLRKINRSRLRSKKNVAFQAFHGYDCSQDNMAAVKELCRGGRKSSIEQGDEKREIDDNRIANMMMCTPPKFTAIGIPVEGEKIMLPKITWQYDRPKGYIIGRNPYGAQRLEAVDDKDVQYSKDLNDLQVFQYTLTGYQDRENQLVASMFKGIMAVIPDEQWPKEFEHVEIVMSSKDEKLNESWTDQKIKEADLNTAQQFNMTSILFVKQQYSTMIVGLPTSLVNKLAGDYDGDPYDLIPYDGYENCAAMVKQESAKAIPSHKIKKSFTRREEDVGNLHTIINLRKPTLAMWNGILNRFYYIPKTERSLFSEKISKNHQLSTWLGDDWQNNLGFSKISPLGIAINEIQLGIKYGEDAYKTTVDINAVLARGKEYEKELAAFSPNAQIPYGNFQKKSVKEPMAIWDAAKAALATKTSANVVDKAYRGNARRLLSNHTYPEYLSDDDDSDNIKQGHSIEDRKDYHNDHPRDDNKYCENEFKDESASYTSSE